MEILQFFGGPEILILALIPIVMVALLFVGYKIVQGFQAFEEGMSEQ